MTVNELRETLLLYPQDAPVVLSSNVAGDNDYDELTADLVEMIEAKENTYGIYVAYLGGQKVVAIG